MRISLLQFFVQIDWQTFLLGEEKWSFLLETAFRTLIMFTVILLSLRLLGKRGIKQLSVFELGVIIGLGSAAGDPMFYKDVGLLPGIIVFSVVIGLYRLVTYFINHSSNFEHFVEGKPICIIRNGEIKVKDFNRELLSEDELFAQLRLHSVSHLAQIEQAIIETNGEISIFYCKDEEVQYGLPILPSLYEQKLTSISEQGFYACSNCGFTLRLAPVASHVCNSCEHKEWVKAINAKRIK
jgi:uncharacterized membrane protein YcaP (DUF421 family)